MTGGATAPTVCVVHEGSGNLTLPFLKAHVEDLPCRTALVHDFLPSIAGRPVLSQTTAARAFRAINRRIQGRDWSWELTSGYIEAFRRVGASAVLAEWGTVAVRVMEACRLTGTPLIAHFHGYDASVRTVLAASQHTYPQLFRQACAIVAVSKHMRQRLIEIGAPAEKVHWNSCGVDTDRFVGGRPGDAPPVFIAVGRFVDKKAPDVTLRAFAAAAQQLPDARLRMIGDGPLLPSCQDLARSLRIDDRVAFLGTGTTETIQREMAQARAFVQHSVTAPSGDMEGTPVVVLEAGSTGLPVISTRHGGIPDVIIEEKTGLLSDEHDVGTMGSHILRLGKDAALAATMGSAGRARIVEHFSQRRSIATLWDVIRTSARLQG